MTAIVEGAVGTIATGDQGSTEEILSDMVEGAQRSLSTLTIASDAERESIVETIVSSAVGSVSSLSGSVSSSSLSASSVYALEETPSARSVLIGIITQVSVENLDDAGFTDAAISDATRASTGAVVRSLRRAGVRSDEIGSTLNQVSSRAVQGLGRANVNAQSASRAVEQITTSITESLDDARVEGVNLDQDLPQLVRQISAGAAASIGSTGIIDLDDTNADEVYSSMVQSITESTTRAVRNVTLTTTNADDLQETLSRVVREVTSSTTEALATVNATATVQINIQITVNAVVRGSTRGVDTLAENFGGTVDMGSVVNEVARGASEGTTRLAAGDADLQQTLENEITQSISQVTEELTSLQTEIATLQQQLATLIEEGSLAAANTAPAAELAVTVGGGTQATYTSAQAPFITGEAGVVIALAAGGSTDTDEDPLDHRWSYQYGPVSSVQFFSDVSQETQVIPYAGLYDTVYITLTRAGQYFFSLVVDDDNDTDEIFFAIEIAGATADNNPPEAIAVPTYNGAITRTFTVGSTVTLDGSGSSDPDGDTLTYTWAREYGPATSTAYITAGGTSLASFVPDLVGDYFFVLQIDDGEYVDEDFFFISVLDATNTVPHAVASVTNSSGSTVTSTTQDDPVLTFSAANSTTGTTANEGVQTLTYQWAWVYGPGIPTFSGTTSTPKTEETVSVTFPSDAEPGTYGFTLKVNDGTFIDDAFFTVEVAAGSNARPTVNAAPYDEAGTTQITSAEQGSIIQLKATATDDTDSAATLLYDWSLDLGPVTGGEIDSALLEDLDFDDADPADLTITLPYAGEYLFVVRVKDSGGLITEDYFFFTASSIPTDFGAADADFQTALDALKVSNTDGIPTPDVATAQTLFSDLVTTYPNYMPGLLGASVVELANIVTNAEIHTFLTETVQITDAIPTSVNDILDITSWMDNYLWTDPYDSTYQETIYFPAVSGMTDDDSDGYIDEFERLQAAMNNIITNIGSDIGGTHTTNINNILDLFAGTFTTKMDTITGYLNRADDSAEFGITWDLVFPDPYDAEAGGWPVDGTTLVVSDDNSDGDYLDDGETNLLTITIGKAELQFLVGLVRQVQFLAEMAMTVDLNLDALQDSLPTMVDESTLVMGDIVLEFPTVGFLALAESDTFGARTGAATHLEAARTALLKSSEAYQRGFGGISLRDNPYDSEFFFSAGGGLSDPDLMAVPWSDVQVITNFYQQFLTRLSTSVSDDVLLVMPVNFNDYPSPFDFWSYYRYSANWPTQPAFRTITETSGDTYQEPIAMALNLGAMFTDGYGTISTLIELDTATGREGEPQFYGPGVSASVSNLGPQPIDTWSTAAAENPFYYVKINDITAGGRFPITNAPGGTVAGLNAETAVVADVNGDGSTEYLYHDVFAVQDGAAVNAYVRVPSYLAAQSFVATGVDFTAIDAHYDSWDDVYEETVVTGPSAGSFWWAAATDLVEIPREPVDLLAAGQFEDIFYDDYDVSYPEDSDYTGVIRDYNDDYRPFVEIRPDLDLSGQTADGLLTLVDSADPLAYDVAAIDRAVATGDPSGIGSTLIAQAPVYAAIPRYVREMGIDSLTIEQLAGIFNGTYTTWYQIDAALTGLGSIHAVAPLSGDALQNTFEIAFVNAGQTAFAFTSGLTEFAGDVYTESALSELSVQANTNSVYGIALMTTDNFRDYGYGDIETIRVDFGSGSVWGEASTVGAGEYPLTRQLHFAYNDSGSGPHTAIQEYIDWLLGDGRWRLRDRGWMPVIPSGHSIVEIEIQ